jgi:hypothetical protein
VPGIWNEKVTNIPVVALREGNVPAFEAGARLAAAGARIGDGSLTEGFLEAWRFLAGLRAGDALHPEQARAVMDGEASEQLGAYLALKPLLSALLDVTIRLFKMAERQVRTAA